MCESSRSSSPGGGGGGALVCGMPWIKSCLCHQEKKKAPVISPPIHLLLKSENHPSAPSHAFRCKVFKKPRPCHLCHQPIFNQGSCCRVCKYVCHKVCESKEAADRFSDTSWQIHRQWHSSKSQPPPLHQQLPRQQQQPQQGKEMQRQIELMPKNSSSIPENGSESNGGIYSTIKRCPNDGDGVPKTTRKKVVEVQIIQTTLEKGRSKNSNGVGLNNERRLKEVEEQIETGSYQQPQQMQQPQQLKETVTNTSTIIRNSNNNNNSKKERIITTTTNNNNNHNNNNNKNKMATMYVQSKERKNGEIIVHTHNNEDLSRNTPRNNNKMLGSYSAIYGEALTCQPRSSRNTCLGQQQQQQHRHHNGAQNLGASMDLSYVTERMIALWFPAACSHEGYKQGQKQASHMLINKHGDNYMVFNLSEPKRTLRQSHKQVQEVGWAPRMAPPLERICSVCKEIDSWLSADQHRIAVLHARGSKDKLGVIVAAYMHYSKICGSAEQALDRFSMRKFLDDNIGPLHLPSNKRYVEYFAGLLSHHIKINSAPLYLTHVTVLGAPSFLNGGCRAFLKLYEGQAPIYTSGVYAVSSGVSQFTVNVAGERRRGLQLRGDILIKCYHRSDRGRETVFACQFHTCAISDYTFSFTKQELDGACNDPRFPTDGAVELHFSPGPESRHPGPAPTPAVPVIMADDDSVTRADSPFEYEDSDDDDDSDSDDVNHTFGPLDGSIYATIAKKQELSPGAVSSPLTVSMDSGISSAGHQQNANTNASSSPPLTTHSHPSPLITPDDQHAELDQLLSDMLLTVQTLPDVKIPSSTSRYAELENVSYIDDVTEDSRDIPYHARQDSRPFSYGVNNNAEMITTDSKTTRLASPSLVRKASFNKSQGNTLNKVQTQVFPDYSSYNTYSTLTKTHQRDPIDDIFTQSALASNTKQRSPPDFRSDYYKKTDLKRSYTDSTLRSLKSPNEDASPYKSCAPFSDPESLSPPGGFRSSRTDFHESYTSNGNLTWLQRQQQKLKERREVKLREERQPYENNLMSELRMVQTRHMRPSASHRLDGYTSDTTAFADDDEDFTIPLHINTKNTSPKERPFVAVKRAHEQYKTASSPSPSSPEANKSSSTPPGVGRSSSSGGDSVDSGLLSLADGKSSAHAHAVSAGDQRQQLQQLQRQLQQSSDPLSDLMANLSHGADKSFNNTPNHTAAPSAGGNCANSSSAWQQHREENYMTWRSQQDQVDSSSPHSVSSSRPQTPAFPVSRAPYTSTPTVQFDLPSERLPPKSPTTTRKLNFPPHQQSQPTVKSSSSSSSTSSSTKKWSDGQAEPERKDFPISPDYSSASTNGSSHHEYVHARTYDTYHQSPKSPSSFNGSSSPTIYQGQSRRSSVNSTNEPPQEVSPVHVKFVSDTSGYWYKPGISRDEAIRMLRDQPPGTFIVRNSTAFPGGFGMALKVSQVPVGVQNKDELVRHFLIEATSRGVKLKGCQNEPVFSSLSALIYQHSITQIALPCRLILPEFDIAPNTTTLNNNQTQMLLVQGAACNVLYLFSLDMESLTGPQAIRKCITEMLKLKSLPTTYTVHFKVNRQGITLTDNKRKLFFRKHYPINTVSHCGVDPDDRLWNGVADENQQKYNNRIFGFVAKKPASCSDNQCHLFAELEPGQPATAIVNFVNKVLMNSQVRANIV